MSLATLSIDMVARTAAFERDLKRTADASEASATRISRAMGAVQTAVGALAGMATVDLFAGMVTRSAEYTDQIGKMAQKIGTTTEEFSALAYAASLADVSNETLAGGLKKLSTEIVSGGEKLAQLGINTKDSFGKLRSNADIMGDVAERFSTMEDGAVKTAIAVDIFGKSGAELIPLLNAGSDGLKASADEAKRFGLIVGKEAAIAAEQFNDNLTRLAALSKGAAVVLTSDLVKGLGEATTAFLKASAEGGKLAGIIAGIQTLLTGNDRFKNDKALVEQTEALLNAQNELDRARNAPIKMPGRILVAEGELRKAQQAIALTQQYRKVLDEADARNAPKPKGPDPVYRIKGDGTGGKPAAVKEVVGDNERALAQYVKGLEAATEKTLELSETDRARNFLTTLGRTGEIAQVRELVLGMAGELDVKRAATEAEKGRITAVQGAMRIADQATAQRITDMDALVNANAALRDEIELIGLDTAARTASTLVKQDQIIADTELALIGARNIDNNEVEIQQLERRLTLLQQQRSLTAERAARQGEADKVLDTKAISERLSDSIVDGLTNGFRDGKNIGTVFLDELKAQFGKAVLQPVIKPIAEAGSAAISNLMTKLLGTFAFADGGVMSADGPAPLRKLTPFANGGIMTDRGPLPLRAYATGGVASTPQLAMYGEGSTPEAFVPLPDGRSIPVTMKGGAGGGSTVVVNISNTVGDVASVSTVVQGMQAVRAQIMGELSRSQRFGGALA